MNQALSINKTRTTDAIALILQLHQKPMILDRLLKMMYFIDSLYLAQTNQSLTNDSYYITKSGLHPVKIPDLISQLHLAGTLAISPKKDECITLVRHPGIDKLTALETKIITHIYLQKRFIDLHSFSIWNYDLNFLQQHTRKNGNTLITPVHIMLNLGKTKAEISTYINSQKLNFAELSNSSSNTCPVIAATSH